MYKKYIKEINHVKKGKSDKWCIECDKYIYRYQSHFVFNFVYPNRFLYPVAIHEDCKEKFIESLRK